MTLNLSIVNKIVRKASNFTSALIVVSNTGTSGMAKFAINSWNGSNCVLYTPDGYTYDNYGATSICVPITNNSYIPSSYFIVGVTTDKNLSGLVCINIFKCINGDNCSGGTCTTYEATSSINSTNIIQDTRYGYTPTLTGLTATPSNLSANVSWNASNDTSYYAIGLYDVYGTIISSGYVSTTSLTISNLINGTTYVIKVQPLGDDYLFGNTMQTSVIPKAPCNTPTCTLSIN